MSQTTKRALAASLKKLMNTIPLSKITINDIVKDCGVNRRTFYYHFKDIYDLLEWIFRTEVNASIESNTTLDTWQQCSLKIFNYLDENKKIIFNVYNCIDRDKLESHLHSAIYKLVFSVVDKITIAMTTSEEEKEFIINYYKVALTGLLLEWIKNKMTEDPNQIIENLNKIVTGDVHKTLLKCESM